MESAKKMDHFCGYKMQGIIYIYIAHPQENVKNSLREWRSTQRRIDRCCATAVANHKCRMIEDTSAVGLRPPSSPHLCDMILQIVFADMSFWLSCWLH